MVASRKHALLFEPKGWVFIGNQSHICPNTGVPSVHTKKEDKELPWVATSEKLSTDHKEKEQGSESHSL